MRALTIQNETVPALGFGTWELLGADCRTGVADALRLGYRHLDTARIYGNEEEVGAGIRDSGVEREEIFLVTKIWPEDYTRMEPAAEGSLRRLGVDHVDLLLAHWPSDELEPEAVAEGLAKVQAAGKARLIGVSNFDADQLDRALAVAPVFTDQVKFHPFERQDALLELCAERDVLLTAYSPLARGRVSDDPVIRAVAEEHGCTPAQATLAWLLAKHPVATIPKAASHEHRRANLAALDVQLSGEAIERLDAIAAS